MHIRTILIIIYCSILHMNCEAQFDFKYKGIIIDGNTNLPIEGAYLKVNNNESNAITDKSGCFSILFKKSISNKDSIIIYALGYKSIKIPISILDKEPIKIFEDIVTLPEVMVQSILNWDNFAKKIKIRLSTSPFESNFQKHITVKQNSENTKEYTFKGYAHDEGFTLKGLMGNLRGRTLKYGVFFEKLPNTNSFINFDGSEEPQLFTEFESGLFYWLFIMPVNKYKIAECKIIDVTTLGGDSIYVIKYEPNIEKSKELIDKIDQRINGRKIGNIYYSSLDKTFYLRKKDFTIIQIDFNQRNEISNTDTNINIRNIREISGTVKFEYFNHIPHPVFLIQNYKYEDKNGNTIDRQDKIYYSNINMIKLSKDELKNKYQLAKIFQTYPRRQFNNIHTERMGPFFYVPTIK